MTPIENASMVLGIVISVSTIISVTALGVRWLVKHYFDEIKNEFKPNGGGSLKDQLNRLESRIDVSETWGKETYKRTEKLEEKLDDLYDKFIDYLSDNKK